MKQLAQGVWRLKQFPAPSVNVYLVEDVLIDWVSMAISSLGWPSCNR